MDPVVARARGEERPGALPAGVRRLRRPAEDAVVAGLRLAEDVVAEQVVGRMPSQEGPVVGIGVAVLSHPGRAGEEVGVPLHVQEGDLADGRAEEPRRDRPRDEVADEQAPVRAADARQLLAARQPGVDEVPRHGLHVLEALVPVLLERGLVPAGTVLAPAPDVGYDLAAAALEPAGADPRAVSRRHRYLDPAVGVQQDRVAAVHDDVLPPHDEVRNFGPVLAGGEALFDDQAVGVEHGGLRLDGLRDGAAVLRRGHLHRVGHEVAVPEQPERVVGRRVPAARGDGHVLSDRHVRVLAPVLPRPPPG
mmetsp:Transcript_3758/g.8734  ORF Transcript_3758/g.8734 Transcript_3758/m.8734 type:complete len:307 (+) Transcript_3758:271-1191(+)